MFDAGTVLEVLHNSYVKGGLALAALLVPGRGLFFSRLIFIHTNISRCYLRNFFTLKESNLK